MWRRRSCQGVRRTAQRVPRLRLRAVADWTPVQLSPRRPGAPAAARVALELPDSQAIVLRIASGLAPRSAEELLRLVGAGAFASAPFHTSDLWPGVVLVGGAITCEGTPLAEERAEVTASGAALPTFPGSVCVFWFAGDAEASLRLGIMLGDANTATVSTSSHVEAMLPVGAVADPTSLDILFELSRSGRLPAAFAPWTCSARLVVPDRTDLELSLQAHRAPWEPVAEEVRGLQPFPLDLMDPINNEVWHPRLWMLCFQPEVLTAVSDIWGYTCTPPLPWGHHFYAQLFLRRCAQLEGDIVELGVAQGGTSAFLGRLAQLSDKALVCVDCFEGLPAPRPDKDNPYFIEGDFGPKEGTDLLQRVKDFLASQGTLDRTTIIKSLFKDVGELPTQKICLAHLDGDLYDSVFESLELVYESVVPGGLIIVDDYFFKAQGPARAVSDFFRQVGGRPPVLHPIPPYAVAIQKGRDLSEPALQGAKRAPDGAFYDFSWLRESEGYLACAEASRARLLAQAKRSAERGARPPAGLLRCLANAERFLTFLQGSEADRPCGRSTEVLEYLSCLELWLDSIGRGGPDGDSYLV